MHEVAVLALPSVVAFELGLPHKLIGGAVDDAGRPLYRVRVATVDGEPVRTSAGYSVLPEHDASILHTAAFRRFFPAVRLDPDVLYVDDGDVLTSAGNAAGIDLCLHLVRRDHGLAVANRVARRSVVSPWREGGQSQFVEPLADVAGEDTAATRAWALERLDQPLGLADLAAHAAMSVRTFTRRFRDETGLSPVRWLTDRRVELARRLLETT